MLAPGDFASNALAALEQPDLGASGRSEWSDFPGEDPPRAKLRDWLDQWDDNLKSIGYNNLLIDRMLPALEELAPRPLLAEDGGRDAEGNLIPLDPKSLATIIVENSRIKDLNARNAAKQVSHLNEYRSRLAARLQRALRPKAPILLKKLETDEYCNLDVNGEIILGSYNGVAMYKTLKKKLDDSLDSTDVDTYTRLSEKFRDTKLPDNCSAQAFSEHMNKFNVKINPFIDVPYKAERLSKLIINLLPQGLASEGRAIRRELEREGRWADGGAVQAAVYDLLKQSHRGDIRTAHAAVGLADAWCPTSSATLFYASDAREHRRRRSFYVAAS